jgi:hypothetical protein
MPPRSLKAPRASIKGPRPQSIVQPDSASSSSSQSSSVSPALSAIIIAAFSDTLETASGSDEDIGPLPGPSGSSSSVPNYRRRANSIRLSLQPKGPRARRASETQPPNSAPLYPSHSHPTQFDSKEYAQRHERSPSISSSETVQSLPIEPGPNLRCGYQRVFSQDYQDTDNWMSQTIDWDVIHEALLFPSPFEKANLPNPYHPT